jgi:peptidoglycan hydrolase-like protein with peptidoglycan-binding domain
MKRLFLLATTALAVAGCAQQPGYRSTPASVASAAPAVPRVEPSATVRDAQQRLRQLGYYNGDIDGLWGSATEDAVIRFQRAHGLDATGQLNAATADVLRDETRLAARPAAPAASKPVDLTDPMAARTVQNRLRQLGFYDGPADGVWGPGTQQALERFQRARGLDRVGEPTVATLSAMGIDPDALARTATASAAEPLDPAVVRSIQRRLSQLGFYRGAADGVWGRGSQAAVERFQRARGLQPTGDLNPTTLAALGFDPNNLAAGPVRGGSVARR